jgi:hypothetical protein
MDDVAPSGRMTDDRWLMNEGSGQGLTEALSQCVPRGTSNTTKISVRITGVPTEFRTQHLQNTDLERHLHVNLLHPLV